MKTPTLFAGAGILFLLVLLLPSCDRGERPLRERVRDTGHEIRDMAGEAAEELKEGAEDVKDALGDTGKEIRKGVEKAKEEWED